MIWDDVKNESDYKNRMDSAIPNIIELLKEFLNAYRNRVNTFYSEAYKENTNFFKFMNFLNIKSICINNSLYHIINNSNSDTDFFSVYYKYLSNTELWKFRDLPSHLRKNHLLNLVNETDCLDIIDGIFPSDCIYPNNLTNHKYLITEKATYLADSDFSNIKFAETLKMACKFYEDLSGFTVLNLSFITSKVNNCQFNYEIEESAKAYQAELYLASATTAEISIETLLRIIIIKKLGKFELPAKSYILTSANLLLNKNVIDEKLFHRIEAINKLRHGLAHSATGEAKKWDCEQIFGLIKILVETFF